VFIKNIFLYILYKLFLNRKPHPNPALPRQYVFACLQAKAVLPDAT
jgi:hypothetical protein